MPPDFSSDLGPGQSVHLLIGAYRFDALYAASFGRKQHAAKAIPSMGTLLNTTNLQGSPGGDSPRAWPAFAIFRPFSSSSS